MNYEDKRRELFRGYFMYKGDKLSLRARCLSSDVLQVT